MCGICGLYYFDNEKSVDENIIKQMCDAMIHRGPDDEGIYLGTKGEGRGTNVGLGIRRLSIIDLKTGHQPIHNENKTIWVVCNGEIYNFRELRSELELKGHKFYTKSDTEVIAHLYEQYGTDFVKKMNGMFAFALWDENSGKLILARDIFGIKPLLYSVSPDGIIFASELNALFKTGLVKKDIDLEAMDDYFSFYFVCSPLTIHSAIKKIPAAHILITDGKKTDLIKYWQPEYQPDSNLSKKYCCEKLQEILLASIKRHLVSDVPLGVFLSGGLDSTTIVAMMNKLKVNTIKTYSIRFNDKSFDESDDAKTVAALYKTEHNELEIGPEIFEKYLPKSILHLGEPNGDWTSAMELCLSEFAKKDVTVILSGTGGDEILAGYPTITAYKIARMYRKFPKLLRALTGSIVNKLPVSMSNLSFDYKAKRFVKGAELDMLRAHMFWKEIFTQEEKENLYSSEVKAAVFGHKPFSVFERYYTELTDSVHPTNIFLYIDSRTFLGDCLLPHADASSMAVSLELRVPYLDKELAEFAGTIPPDLKHRYFTTKYIFREAVKNLFPKRIIKKKKMGFSAPISKWIKNDLYDFSRGTVLDGSLMKSGLFNRKYIEGLFDSHRKNIKDNGRRIQSLVSFALWHNNSTGGL
ncbi:MAG: asparagine synthase (glutamine-hydrolyzing) [Elusimicrobiota bacterium]|nr:asparagine synthase (glutamine-hydrolyzing) [Elusimicrobiota bacterium]